MRYRVPLIALALACYVLLVVIALHEHRRANALEQQLAARQTAAVAAKKPAAGRTFVASDGTVLTAEDLDRADARDREVAKAAAELEYFVKKGDKRR